MSQLAVIYKKEMVEMWRNLKWIWIPLVFILFGILQPLSTYFMPQLLDALGGLPEGAVIEIPTPSGAEMMASTLSQFNSIGVLILVLAFMGHISSEINSGVASMVMVKPVKYSNYMLGKWLGAATLTIASVSFGYIAAWYYTDLLFEPVEMVLLFNSFLIYSVWFLFVVTVTIFFSTIIKSSGGVAALSILVALSLSILPSIAPKLFSHSPGVLTRFGDEVLLTGEMSSGFLTTLLLAIAIILTLIAAAIYFFRSAFHSS